MGDATVTGIISGGILNLEVLKECIVVVDNGDCMEELGLTLKADSIPFICNLLKDNEYSYLTSNLICITAEPIATLKAPKILYYEKEFIPP